MACAICGSSYRAIPKDLALGKLIKAFERKHGDSKITMIRKRVIVESVGGPRQGQKLGGGQVGFEPTTP